MNGYFTTQSVFAQQVSVINNKCIENIVPHVMWWKAKIGITATIGVEVANGTACAAYHVNLWYVGNRKKNIHVMEASDAWLQNIQCDINGDSEDSNVAEERDVFLPLDPPLALKQK